MNNNTKKPRGTIAISEKTLQKSAARVLTSASRLVSTEVLYLQRVLGAAATQVEIDQSVAQVRKLPWTTIAPGEY